MYGNPMINNSSKQPGLNKVELVSKQDTGVGFKREWCCERCKDPINIFVPDTEKKYVLDGDQIFCGIHCRSAYKDHIPVKLAKNGKAIKYKKAKHQQKDKAKFKCFHCSTEYDNLTFDKLCPHCSKNMANTNRLRQGQGEFLALVGSLTNEQRSLIRLSKIN